MKNRLLLIMVSGLLCAGSVHAQNMKYVDNIYPRSSVTVTKNIMYQDAFSVLSGSPKLDTFRMDIYDPTQNTGSARPLIIYTHTGSFLPRYQNGSTTGARDDSATVEICKRFAEKGYVVASISYRLGWNPYAATEELRKESIINAAYRSVQDLNTAIRFFKKNIKVGGNTWNLDSTKFVIGGQGTGGYVVYAQSGLQRQSEIKISKFQNFTTGKAMVNDTLWGDLNGYKISAGSVLARPNHPGHTNTVKIGFAIGGAMGDTSWMEPGEIPLIALQGISDPFAPYKTGMVYVPGTSPPQAVVVVQGAHDVMQKEVKLKNNACYADSVHDWWTQYSKASNDGISGLYGFAGAANGSGPWEWWDSSYLRVYLKFGGLTGPQITTILAGSSQANPLMSKTRAMKYIDTCTNFIAPRLAVCLGYYTSVGIKNAKLISGVSVYPNPTTGKISIDNNNSSNHILSATLMDLNGRVIKTIPLNGNHTIADLDVKGGMYLLNLQFAEGNFVKKVLVN